MYPIQVKNLINKINWKGLYFGGVAFKYQKPVNDLIKATKIACKYLDVITTSGTGTGIAAEPKKITTMAKIIKKKNKTLAIASGITIDNIKNYKYVKYFLVATGISKDFFTFNSSLVKELSDKINELNQLK